MQGGSLLLPELTCTCNNFSTLGPPVKSLCTVKRKKSESTSYSYQVYRKFTQTEIFFDFLRPGIF